MAQTQNSFTAFDLADSMQAFSQWQGKAHESVDEYTLRKRKQELYALVRKVIKNELSPEQQKVVRLRWYEQKSMSEVAKILGVDKATISRKEKKINEIIYDKLKYAMEYRFGKSFSEESRLIIKSNTKACMPCDESSISQRLYILRLRQSLSEDDIAKLTGISKSRIKLFEKDASDLTINELSSLARLYGTTSDYIIFGTSKEEKI